MGSPRILVLLALSALDGFVAPALAQNAAAPDASTVAPPDSKPAPAPAMGSLRICLRLQDETPFAGTALVRVLPDKGDELLGIPGDSGEFVFSGITSGKYLVAISAPGFLDLQLTTQLEGGPRQKALFVPMKQRTATNAGPNTVELQLSADPTPPAAAGPSNEAPASPAGSSFLAKKDVTLAEAQPEPPAEAAPPLADPAPAAPGRPDYWDPRELETVPPVDPDVACPADAVFKGVGQRMSEFVGTLEKFTATENLEHYAIDRTGQHKPAEKRSFAYVVSVQQNYLGTFILEEFRDGNTDAEAFPAHTATRGSPAMALIFHPALAGGFDFRCEGMGEWRGHPAWLVHFAQRPEKPIQIRSYSVNGRSFGVALEGRVWIDPGNDQVMRLESELVKPIEPIELTREHFTIDYQPVEFHSTGQQLWLPQAAELYVERKGKRFYRRHTFSDFRLFNVDAAQNIRPPGESFSFTNSSDHDVTGELTVTRREGLQGDPVVLRFVVPAHGRVFKAVGPGKDVSMPVTAVGAATFVHEGEANAVKVDARLVREASLDVVSQTKVPLTRLALPPLDPLPVVPPAAHP